MLTQQRAEELLRQAASRNPGRWEAHSRVAADCARRIAQKLPGLDPERAWLSGLLHDIGRGRGVSGLRHALDGYDDLMALGEPELARICLTHSFPDRREMFYMGAWDITDGQRAFLRAFLLERDYDGYDRLIQLCDMLALPTGPCILEKRIVDVTLRYGAPEGTLDKWRSWLALKEEIDGACGCDVYTLLPGVAEHSFASLR